MTCQGQSDSLTRLEARSRHGVPELIKVMLGVLDSPSSSVLLLGLSLRVLGKGFLPQSELEYRCTRIGLHASQPELEACCIR